MTTAKERTYSADEIKARLARDLPSARGSLTERVASLQLAEVELEPWEDVDDPAGGEPEVFHQCAIEIHELLAALRLQGFTIVEAGTPGGVSRIVPEADAKLQGGRVVAPATTAPRGDQIVTQVFRLNYENATTLVPDSAEAAPEENA